MVLNNVSNFEMHEKVLEEQNSGAHELEVS